MTMLVSVYAVRSLVVVTVALVEFISNKIPSLGIGSDDNATGSVAAPQEAVNLNDEFHPTMLCETLLDVVLGRAPKSTTIR